MAARLANRLCVVTGGAHGIGKATAALFAREGASVVIADRDGPTGTWHPPHRTSANCLATQHNKQLTSRIGTACGVGVIVLAAVGPSASSRVCSLAWSQTLLTLG
jgi:NAD(P)-dependent dehydrogenase (short-subunit alcohol dehydrogenase family)